MHDNFSRPVIQALPSEEFDAFLTDRSMEINYTDLVHNKSVIHLFWALNHHLSIAPPSPV